jgi:phosphoadenosine phosphosulfate reductase
MNSFKRLIPLTIKEIQVTATPYKKIYVMFSGGKDSLVALDVTIKAIGSEKVEVLYIDTGIATPGLKDYIDSIVHRYGLKLNIAGPKYNFFELVEKLGFPMIKYRWCKRYLKIEPLQDFVKQVKERYKPILLITGLRKDESWFKAKGSKFYRHPKLEVDVYAPLFEWSSEDIEKYIMTNNLPINPFYKIYGKAYDCWCTVFKTPADFAILAINHPQFFEKFVDAERKLRKGGSALYYKGQKIYLRDIQKNPYYYLHSFPQGGECPLCKIF